MSDWAAQIPTAVAAAALLSVGGALMRLRQLDKALEKAPTREEVKNVVASIDRLNATVTKLADDKLGELDKRIGKLEVWSAGHEQQATERWAQVHPKRDGE